MSVTIRGTSIREEETDLMAGFRSQREEVPEHVGVLEIGVGVSLLGMNEIGEFLGVSNEEDGGVVTDQVVVTFFSVELDGKTSGISFSISGTLFTTDSGESEEDRSSLTNGIE
jgi:hypothetical protein